MSRPVVAICVWETFVLGQGWIADPDEPAACRASVAERILTVWLPRGAKIRCRGPRYSPKTTADQTYTSWFRARGVTRRITIRVTHYPTLTAEKP